MPHRRPAAVALVVLASSLAAQDVWRRVDLLEYRRDHAMAADPVRGRVVLFGGQSDAGRLGDTWEWDGQRWHAISTTTAPPARSGHCMAYDSLRRRIVLFGGEGSGSVGADTWQFDGRDWRQIRTDTLPAVSGDLAMAYHPGQDRIILMGRTFPGLTMWSFDGVDWTESTATPRPNGLNSGAMVSDTAHGELVFVGRSDSSWRTIQTWIWDGAWRHASSTGLEDTDPRGLAYDPTRRRPVLVSLSPGSPSRAWDGTQWQTLGSTAVPPPRGRFAVAYDTAGNGTLLFGGQQSGTSFADTWRHDGLAWHAVAGAPSPLERNALAAAWCVESAGILTHGGRWTYGVTDRTRLWDGRQWTELAVGPSPARQSGHSMTPAIVGDGAFLFGRRLVGNTQVAETWRFRAAAWEELSPNHVPPARTAHVMARHDRQRRIVLFGGFDNSEQALADTWEWDGNDWVSRSPAASPSARFDAAMAYDHVNDRVVLFGGRASPGRVPTFLDDTWTWDGTTWTQSNPATTPPARFGHSMTWDAESGSLLMHGGSGYGTPDLRDDTWRWDGSNWRLVSRAGPRGGAVLVHDPLRRETVMVARGMRTGPAELDDVWIFGRQSRFDAFGAGCAGTAGIPELFAADRTSPAPGSTLRLRVIRLAPTVTATWLVLGFSRTSWFGQFPLPADLTPLGMPGCALHVRGDLAFTMSTRQGTASIDYPIPDTPAVIGMEFFAQAFAFEPAANALGFVVSNAGLGSIRAR